MSDQTKIEAVVCIPTFRRPDWLARTLASLAEQTADFRFAIVVVDNDAANPLGRDVAGKFFAAHAIANVIVTEEKQGNCFAINRAFSEALKTFPEADFFLMIDDDETAAPCWLAEMVGLAGREAADIVGGPVVRNFEGAVPEEVRIHPLFLSIDGATREIDQLHGSGNCLIRRHVFEKLGAPFFDLRFNFLGGGDMDFFTRCRRAGFRTLWNSKAEIQEFVPPERTSARFLMTRSIRTGSINYMVDRANGMPAAVACVKTLASLGLGVLRSIAALARTRRLLPASHPLLLPVGRAYAALGFLPAPYKASDVS
ncbi:glycosyltransferase family 2 protein [Labrenzia sp. OB1]|uniref:glycosyltransferase family 2 protein n=1 Tax=Labrenzia sp. OB1 TaxID=1561204 RepID=UPI0007B2BAEE|nr:glycosyltransferase family 2 protein [Labrenzia sp. OB1]KZM49969.1 glycosyl transferase family A [Labrenzia sp. OB1]